MQNEILDGHVQYNKHHYVCIEILKLYAVSISLQDKLQLS